MGLVDEIPAGSRIALDTNALIYFIEEHPDFGPIVTPLFREIDAGTYTAVVSVVSLIEVLVHPLRAGDIALADRYRRLLIDTKGLSLLRVTVDLAEKAAEVRSETNLLVPDALVAATAVLGDCTHLVANDDRFQRVSAFRTLVVRDFVAS